MMSDVNVARVERWASALGGAALAAWSAKQFKDDNPVAGAVLAAAGGTLIFRGATGVCPVYSATGVNTATGSGTREALSGSGGVNVSEVVTIDRPAHELYQFWRRLNNLPRFMEHLVAVEEQGPRRSHWIAKAPAGRTVEWDAEIINEVPGELIGWRTLNGADVVSAGSVRFLPVRDGHGTDVHVRLQYDPPAGKLGSSVAWLLGLEPSLTIREDLRRLKQWMEVGDTAAGRIPAKGARS